MLLGMANKWLDYRRRTSRHWESPGLIMRIRPRLKSLEQLLAERNLEAIACLSPENFTYLAGVHITTVENIRPRLAFAILRRTGAPFLVICGIETTLSRSSS